MKDNKLSKYLSILVAVIAVVGAFLFIRVFLEEEDAIKTDAAVQGSVIDPIIYFSKWLLYITIAVTVVLSVWSVIKNPQNLKKLVLGLGILAVVLFISYTIADSEAVLDMQGNLIEGGDADTSTNKWVGTGIWFSVALALIASVFFVIDLAKGLIKS